MMTVTPALDEEGIYRVSAGVAKIKRIRHEFDSGIGLFSFIIVLILLL
jgi:hypothetical protein